MLQQLKAPNAINNTVDGKEVNKIIHMILFLILYSVAHNFPFLPKFQSLLSLNK